MKLEPLLLIVGLLVIHWTQIAAFPVPQARSAPQLPTQASPVSDATAYRHWLVMASVPANATPDQLERQAGHLRKLQLSPADELAVKQTLADFRSRYDAFITKWNAKAIAEGPFFDRTSLLQQREDIIAAARTALELTLSAKGALRLQTHIQTFKEQVKEAQ
jgi:hypothetical protein